MVQAYQGLQTPGYAYALNNPLGFTDLDGNTPAPRIVPRPIGSPRWTPRVIPGGAGRTVARPLSPDPLSILLTLLWSSPTADNDDCSDFGSCGRVGYQQYLYSAAPNVCPVAHHRPPRRPGAPGWIPPRGWSPRTPMPPTAAPGGTGSGGPPTDCRAVAAQCREDCQEDLLVGGSFAFWRCVNRCLEENGCPVGMY